MLDKYKNLQLITDNRVKNSIIDIIYDNVNFYHIKYQLITDEKYLDELYGLSNSYFITPHLLGISCLILVHPKFNTPLIIVKKDLKFYRNQVNINMIKIFRLISDDYIIQNKITLIDGKFSNIGVRQDANAADYQLLYCIHDIYVYNDNKLLSDKLDNKYTMCSDISEWITSFTIKFSNLTESFNDLPTLLFDKIKNSKFKINGLIFLPHRSGKSYIYINDSEFADLKTSDKYNNIYHKYLSIPNIPLNIHDSLLIDNNTKTKFVLKKTKISDVYEIYNYRYMGKDELFRNITEENYLNIAHVPTTKLSHYLKDLSNKNIIFVLDCLYSPKFGKWMPLLGNNGR